jgi:ABC-type sugar transport system permease subunit
MQMHSKTWHRQVRSYISFLLPAFVLYTIFWVLPILFNLVVSFSKWNGMTQLWKTKWVGFQNYTRMFKDNIFAQAITHNFEFTILSVVFIPTVAFLIAILIEKGIKRKGFFRTTLFIPAVLPMLLVAILFRWVFSVDNGMINSFLGAVGLKALETNFLGNSNTALLSLFSLSVWKSAPFYMVIILAGLQSVPHELEEAASIDGCSGAQSLRYITRFWLWFMGW